MLSHAPNEHVIIDCVKKFTLVKTKLRTPMAGLRRYFKPTTLLPTASETWIVSTFDYLRANTSIVFNGFQEAGIVHAIQNGPQVLNERRV